MPKRFAGTALGGVHGGIVDCLLAAADRQAVQTVRAWLSPGHGHRPDAMASRRSRSRPSGTWSRRVLSVSLPSAARPEARVIAQYQPLPPDEHERSTIASKRKLAGPAARGRAGWARSLKFSTPLVAFYVRRSSCIDHELTPSSPPQRRSSAWCEC